MKWPSWRKQRPQEPKPAPVLYDWQQDRNVITDLKLWNVFTVQIDPNVTAGYVAVHAEKPKQGERVVPRDPQHPVEYGETVKPWGPGAHVTGARGGWEGSE